jgi:hypothetical protein
MSKQSEAKAAQDYIPKAHNCADCASLKSDMVMPQWMIDSNIQYENNGYGLHFSDSYRNEKNIRCGIGGFAVKKSGICSQHVAKD